MLQLLCCTVCCSWLLRVVLAARARTAAVRVLVRAHAFVLRTALCCCRCCAACCSCDSCCAALCATADLPLAVRMRRALGTAAYVLEIRVSSTYEPSSSTCAAAGTYQCTHQCSCDPASGHAHRVCACDPRCSTDLFRPYDRLVPRVSVPYARPARPVILLRSGTSSLASCSQCRLAPVVMRPAGVCVCSVAR